MKLKIIINTIYKHPDNVFKPYYGDLAEKEFDMFELFDQDWINPRLKAYGFNNWMCTDTIVGGTILYLDDEPVAQGWQTSRKNNIIYKWFSQKCYDKVRLFLESKVIRDPKKIQLISLEDNYFK